MSTPSDPAVRLTVDGTPLTVPAHRTVAAALMLEGEDAGWRTTRRTGEQRGLFCGIGVCFDCLATVDGRRGQRTCLVEVADGMDVRTGTDDD
ncbi:(2Fe-2S)-binding protein [Brachybacterium vulturis]|uniref:(2Fe-2S)-binding protein n=1 Tax=Brachybacterium vulturis TaxID=2017484 RepID=UPI003736DC1C